MIGVGRARTLVVVELSLALLAIVGCVWSWVAAASPAQIEPVVAGEAVRGSINYDPLLLTLSLVLATAAGVLVVLGFRNLGGLRRTR